MTGKRQIIDMGSHYFDPDWKPHTIVDERTGEKLRLCLPYMPKFVSFNLDEVEIVKATS